MIPIRDVNPSRSTPWVTYALFTANLAVFAYQLSLLLGPNGDEAYGAFFYRAGLIPDLLLQPSAWFGAEIVPPLTVLSSMFVHGDLLHLGGNMLYLWIFADNVEDAMGPGRFLAFYLLCGLAAAATQVVLMPDSTVPMVGASGAIAGVLGAYLILYPSAQVLTLVFLLIFVRVMYLPAIILLGLWFLLQVMSAGGASEAGVAWYAHIGGFVAGILLIGGFANRVKSRVVPIDSWRY